MGYDLCLSTGHMKSVSDFCCLNEVCPDYGKKGTGNIIVHCRYGKHDEIWMLKCKTCGIHFSERKNTLLYNCKMPENKALEIIHHLSKGCGIRKTSRLTGASRDAVSRLARMAEQHLIFREAQFDDKWSSGKKRAI
jgi:hypothetical protein